MLNNIQILNNVQNQFLKSSIPNVKVGDIVKIGIKITEGSKKRIQFYEGVVISKKNTSINSNIIVRNIIQNIGVERTFLLHSPQIISITRLKSSKINRSKLYYLRNLKGKNTRLKQII